MGIVRLVFERFLDQFQSTYRVVLFRWTCDKSPSLIIQPIRESRVERFAADDCHVDRIQ